MGFFDVLRGNAASPPPEPVPLEQTCYDIAYFLLPQYVFKSIDRLVEMCTQTPSMAGPLYYVMACQARGVEPDIEIAKRFIWRHGELSQHKYLALEFPTPPPVDFSNSDPAGLMREGRTWVLAPHFCAILYGDGSPPQYYILGQAPFGGTTLRGLEAGGANCNLGPGPEPNLELFLIAIESRASSA